MKNSSIIAASIIAIGLVAGGALAGRNNASPYDPGERWYALQEYATTVELLERDLSAFGQDHPQVQESSRRMKEASKRLDEVSGETP